MMWKRPWCTWGAWPQPKPDEALARTVEDEFLAVDEQYFAALVDLNDPADPAALRDAIAFVEEWRVAVWARRCFVKTGAARGSDCIDPEALRREQPRIA